GELRRRVNFSMRSREFKAPDVRVTDLSRVDQTLRARRDCRFRTIFSDICQPLRLARAGGRDSEQVSVEFSRRKNNLSPLGGPNWFKGHLTVRSDPLGFPDRLEIFGKSQ